MTLDRTLSHVFLRAFLPWTMIGLLCGTIVWPFAMLAWIAGGWLGLFILLMMVAPASLPWLFAPATMVVKILLDYPDREAIAAWTVLLPKRLAALGGGLAGMAFGTVSGWTVMWGR